MKHNLWPESRTTSSNVPYKHKNILHSCRTRRALTNSRTIHYCVTKNPEWHIQYLKQLPCTFPIQIIQICSVCQLLRSHSRNPSSHLQFHKRHSKMLRTKPRLSVKSIATMQQESAKENSPCIRQHLRTSVNMHRSNSQSPQFVTR